MLLTGEEFKKCCVIEIKRIWDLAGSSMNVVSYEGNCSVCGHYIGLTQTPTADAEKFLLINKFYFEN